MPTPLQTVRRSRKALPDFTLREKQVLRDLAENKPLKETAADLGINLNTVEYHRSKIVRKTGISGVAGLTQFALRYGLAGWIVCLVLMAGCAPKTSAPVRQMAATVGEAPLMPFAWLTWSNEETWVVNVVDYRTNLGEPWKVYAYVSNAYTNTPRLPLYNTNQQSFFRVGRIPGFW